MLRYNTAVLRTAKVYKGGMLLMSKRYYPEFQSDRLPGNAQMVLPFCFGMKTRAFPYHCNETVPKTIFNVKTVIT